MKKITKKLVTLITALIMVISLVPMTAGAAKVGDVIGYAQPTDIVAMINGYQLESYNVEGSTYICVEDLKYYGFRVTYDNSARTLSVRRSTSTTEISPEVKNPNFWSIGSNNKKIKMLYTDIKTYLGSTKVTSYNLNGKTIIKFDKLSKYGKVEYNNDRREITLELDDLNTNDVAELATRIQNGYFNSSWKCRATAKGSVLVLKFTARSYMSQSDRNSYIASKLPGDKDDIEELLETYKDNNWSITSIYAECCNSDGKAFASFQID